MSAPGDTSTSELAGQAPPKGASLTELQNWMVRLLSHHRGLAKSKDMQVQAAVHFSGNVCLSPAQQVDIYRRQFWLRQTGILIDHFPGLTRIIDQKDWEPIAESYLRTYGRDVFALSDLGKDMAKHLETRGELAHQELCIDMARLEWAYQEAFGAPDDPALSAEKVQAIPPGKWPHAILRLSESLRLLDLRYPAASIRRRLRKNPSQVDLDQVAQELATGHPTVVYRREGTLWDKEVSRSAFSLLLELKRGKPIVPACQAVVQSLPEAEAIFDTELMTWFALWGRLGWIVDIEVP